MRADNIRIDQDRQYNERRGLWVQLKCILKYKSARFQTQLGFMRLHSWKSIKCLQHFCSSRVNVFDFDKNQVQNAVHSSTFPRLFQASKKVVTSSRFCALQDISDTFFTSHFSFPVDSLFRSFRRQEYIIYSLIHCYRTSVYWRRINVLLV